MKKINQFIHIYSAHILIILALIAIIYIVIQSETQYNQYVKKHHSVIAVTCNPQIENIINFRTIQQNNVKSF